MQFYYEERFVWPLTSSTSIYSGVSSSGGSNCCVLENDSVDDAVVHDDTEDKRNSDSSDIVLQWATQFHTCSLQFCSETNAPHLPQPKQPILHSKSILPRNDDSSERNNTKSYQQHCIGYFATNKWEVFTFMDTSKVKLSYENVPPPQQQQQSLQNTAPTTTTTATTTSSHYYNNNDDDDNHSVTASITTTITGIPSHIGNPTASTTIPNSHHHRRNSSFSSIPESIMMDPMDHTTNLLDSVSNINMNTNSISHLHTQFSSMSGQHQHHPSSSMGEFSTTVTNQETNESNLRSHYMPNMTIIDTNQIGQLYVRHNVNRTQLHLNVTDRVSALATGGKEEEYRTTLDFRPLAVTISEIDIDTGSTILIWIGSADQNQLHCYTVLKQQTEPSPAHAKATITSSNDGLRTIRIDQHAAFVVLSPVMAIQYVQWKESDTAVRKHCVVLACQDGTVRVVVFDIQIDSSNDNTISFHNVQENQVIIDGPIVAIHAQRRVAEQTNDPSTMHVTIGSLCGYVAEIHINLMTMEFLPKEGPSMVVQGFWNCRLQIEDSVMSIYRYKDYVCVGTQAGRCYLYRNLFHHNADSTSNDKKQAAISELSNQTRYHLEWSCQLPYPIHSIVMLSNQYLFITTRRTVHLFEQRHHPSGIKYESIIASANHMKEMILQLQRQNEAMKEERELQKRSEAIILVDAVANLHDHMLSGTPNIEQFNSISDTANEEPRITVPILNEEKDSDESKELMMVSELVDLV